MIELDGGPLQAAAILPHLSRMAADPDVTNDQLVRWLRVVLMFGISAGDTVIVPPAVRRGESEPFASVNHPDHPRKLRAVSWAPRT